MAAAEVVRARMDSDLKQEVTIILRGMGLSMSDAIRLLFVRVAADKALPFDVRVPNAKTREAMLDVRAGRTTRAASVAALMADLDTDD